MTVTPREVLTGELEPHRPPDQPEELRLEIARTRADLADALTSLIEKANVRVTRRPSTGRREGKSGRRGQTEQGRHRRRRGRGRGRVAGGIVVVVSMRRSRQPASARRRGARDIPLACMAAWGSAVKRLLYKPLGLVLGAVAGAAAGAIFKRVWRLASGEDEAPSATDVDHTWVEIVAATAIQGAIFAAVKAAVDRGGAVREYAG